MNTYSHESTTMIKIKVNLNLNFKNLNFYSPVQLYRHTLPATQAFFCSFICEII